MNGPTSIAPFAALDTFARRHIGPSEADIAKMLQALELSSLDALVERTVPAGIRLNRPLAVDAARAESEVLARLEVLAGQNQVARSYLGLGYHATLTPGVILRNILENPGWYTQYTPYQAEISQGRMEMLLNFQTLVSDLSGLPVANASMLDEGTAAAEAMAMCLRAHPGQSGGFFIDAGCHPQTIDIVRGRAAALGIEVTVGDHRGLDFDRPLFGVLVQFPTTNGTLNDYRALFSRARAAGAFSVLSLDPLAATLFASGAEQGADVCVGSMQRFGVPMGFGGPHAAYLTATDAFKRQIPGRVIGVSRDAQGRPALRLSLQTREQHIRRDKATSNICTAQVLLANIAAAYACYHGPDGLRDIAARVRRLTATLRVALVENGDGVPSGPVFDTLRVRPRLGAPEVFSRALAAGINLRDFGDGSLSVTFDETVTAVDLVDVLAAFGVAAPDLESLVARADESSGDLERTTPYLTHPVFHAHRSETEMLRYLARLESRDLSLVQSMIPLGSCTMKLNATTEMRAVTWPGFGQLHPFAPADQTLGYRQLFAELSAALAELTGFDAVSLQPNAGSQGEYAGLLVIRAWHASRGDSKRDVCLIPVSAHGTNPASAVMAGFDVVVVKCDANGNVDLGDLEVQASKHAERLSALMITYPSTHGVFETQIKEICALVHRHGGQVYMDGANMNAQVGLCRPGDIGADVCHLNLHKTFAIPHGGGGPGMGPIGVRSHLAPFLPGHPVVEGVGGEAAIPSISAAPWGSASVLTISWAYIALMGADGLRRATEVAILNANYIARRLDAHYPVLYRGEHGFVAHECIIDLRGLKATSGVEVEDVAKRLMDYGFHAPTMSFPVPGTLMIEPTESESKAELDRFCDALIAIRDEIRQIERGDLPRDDNPLKNAPHTVDVLATAEWPHPYSRATAAFPTADTRAYKFWPTVGRVDNAFGDRNLVCTCPPLEAYIR